MATNKNGNTKIAASDSNEYVEIFYINNGWQSNIYCSTKLRYPSTTQERFLVATLKGKVSCLERHEDSSAQEKFHSSHDMQAREVYFSYIPGDAEVISMDAFYRHGNAQQSESLIVGVTLILMKTNQSEVTSCHYFNIYNALEPGTEFDLDKLAQVCQHQRLGFTPYHLHHGDIYVNGEKETVFLMAGSDNTIHLFQGDTQQRFEETTCVKYFPEFADICGQVIWMHVKNKENYLRMSAFGCDRGYVRVALVNALKSEQLKVWSLTIDGPISSVRLFTLTTEKEEIFSNSQLAHAEPGKTCCPDVNLLVTSMLELSAVYLDVATEGFAKMSLLRQSDQYDSVTCSCVTDIDCDGNNEIILGTYGQSLLVYKWSESLGDHLLALQFDLVWQQQFPRPLISIHGLDMMGDGMLELVLVSLTGVHILQHGVSSAANKLMKKLKRLTSREDKSASSELEDVIQSICTMNNPYNKLS